MIDVLREARRVVNIEINSATDNPLVFSNDGKKIVFSSNRNNGGTRETNVFIADWVE